MDLDIQVSKLKLMKANHTSQKYRLEDNITQHYPHQIAIFKERIEGFTIDMEKYAKNKPEDKEQFFMQVGGKPYTDKKEAGTAIIATQDITEYDEQLVRRLIEKITVYDEKVIVEFKSGTNVDIHR